MQCDEWPLIDKALFFVVGVVPNDSRVLQGVPCYKDTKEEAGVCHEPHEAPGMPGEALSCKGLLLQGAVAAGGL